MKHPRRRKKTCPKCGNADFVPILYGYPTQELFADEARGRIALGGCVIFGNDPRKLCKACGAEFDRPRARARKSG